MEVSPWKEPQPLEQLKQLASKGQLAIKAAFAVNPLLQEMRVPRRESAGSQLIGAEHVLAFTYVDKLPPLEADPAAPPNRELVVTTRKEPDYKKHLYRTLEHALLDAKPGDVIRLQQDGEVSLDPVKLSAENLTDLTIRADAGFHPVLMLRERDQVNAPALFEIYNGKLRLEGLEVRLRPRREDEGCSLLSFLGDGECILKSCLVTLERSSGKTALAVLPEKRMKKSAAATPTPHLTLKNCFVRGQGDLLWTPGSHAAVTDLDNSLIALSGSLLNVESDKKDEQTPSAAALVLRLHKVTTYLGESLIRLHTARDIKGLVKTRCEPTDCLFLPAGDRALVRLEGPEGEERGLRERFAWESNGKNAYGSFAALFEQKWVGAVMMMPPPSNQETWIRDVSGETNSEYNAKLSHPPAADAAFTQLLPAAFRPADGLKDYGVDVAALRSLPALKGKTDVPDVETDIPDRDIEQESSK